MGEEHRGRMEGKKGMGMKLQKKWFVSELQ